MLRYRRTTCSTARDQRLFASLTAFDELRRLNNTVKHNGTVNTELATYPGWTQGEPLGVFSDAYPRLSPGGSAYFRELVGELINQAT